MSKCWRHVTIVVQDLKNAKSMVDWIAWAEPQYNFNPMIDEWCREAPKELDFNHEAGMLNPASLSYQNIRLCLVTFFFCFYKKKKFTSFCFQYFNNIKHVW